MFIQVWYKGNFVLVIITASLCSSNHTAGGGGCYSAMDTFTLFNLHAVSQGICLIVNIVHNIYLHKLQKNNKNSLVFYLSPITLQSLTLMHELLFLFYQ